MKIKIANKLVGENEPCFIIAEAGVNHNGSLEIAKKLIDAAKEAGADAVKFQTFRTEGVVTKDAPVAMHHEDKKYQTEILKELELKYEDFRKLKEYCDKKGIIFLSTAHCDDAADFLENLVPAYKIGSGDLTNIPFLEKVAQKGKPMILSTGMADLNEVKEAVNSIKKYNDKVILLHCTTSYPCKKEDVNLKAMLTLKKEFNVPVGYSDHTMDDEASLAALSFGPCIIERHFTLDKNMRGPDHKASLSVGELKELINNIRKNKKLNVSKEILGNGMKKPSQTEIEMKKTVRKSIIANMSIKKGTKITREMLSLKRPEQGGILPREINKVIGKTAIRDIENDSQIKWEMLK